MTRSWIAGAALALALAGCGDDGTDKASLGAEPTPTPTGSTLAAACGHPGARVDYATADLPVHIDYQDCDVSRVEFYVDGEMLGTGPTWIHSSGNLSGDAIGVAEHQRASGCYSFQSSAEGGFVKIYFAAEPCTPVTTP